MKWDKAIKQIEAALAEGKTVEIQYHRKWTRNSNEYKWDIVTNVTEYDWFGQICKAVNTYHDQINEGNFIVDEINT